MDFTRENFSLLISAMNDECHRDMKYHTDNNYPFAVIEDQAQVQVLTLLQMAIDNQAEFDECCKLWNVEA